MQADSLLILGVNHKVAPVEVREKLAYTGDCENPVIAIQKIAGSREGKARSIRLLRKEVFGGSE